MGKQKKEEICKNCKYYKFEKCRRYPPDPSYSDTDENNWCGEFSQNKK